MSEEKDLNQTTTPSPQPKKGLGIGMYIAITLLCCLATFMITFGFMAQHSRPATGTGGTEGEFMQKVLVKLGAMDASVRQDFMYELDDDALLDGVLSGYMNSLGDRYAIYYTKEDMASFSADTVGEMEGIGVSVVYDGENNAIQIISVFNDSPAASAGLLPGDRIAFVQIEGEEGYSAVAELGYNAALNHLRGPKGTEAKFIAYRENDYNNPIEYSVKRESVTEITVEGRIYASDPTVGVIRITSFDLKTPEQFNAVLEDLKAKGAEKLILDVRNNPGGELTSVCQVLDVLLPKGTVVRTVDKEGNEEVVYTSDESEVSLPMAVLANGNTASAGELFTAALVDYDKATFVGTKTFGKGSMQTVRTFNDGSGMKYTYRFYCPPTSDNYDGVGVTPDVEVEIDEQYKNKNVYTLTDAEDNQLAAAYQTLIK